MTIAHIVNASFDWNSDLPIGHEIELLLDEIERKGAKVYPQSRHDYWVVEANLSPDDFFRESKSIGLSLTKEQLFNRIDRISL